MELRDLLKLPRAVALDAADDWVLVGADFSGTQQLYRLDGDGLEQLTDLAGPVEGLVLPDGRVLVARDEEGDERHQLQVLEDGALKPLVVEPGVSHWTPAASRDGRLLAYACNRRNGRDFDVFVRELESGEERCVFDRGGYVAVAGFSPGGGRLAIRRETERAGDTELWLVELETGDAVEAFPHDDEAAYLGAPAWLDDRRFFVASSIDRDTVALVREDGSVVVEDRWDLECWTDPAGQTLLVEANVEGRSRLELRDPETLEVRTSIGPGGGVVEHPVFSPDGARLLFSFSSPVEPPNVWAYDLTGGVLERLTAIERPRGLGRPELYRFASFDGLSVPVFLWAPAGEGPFPVVVMVHGGPEEQFRPGWLPSFTPLTQHLVACGFAVAAPNIRGSTGYGKHYEHLDDVRLRLDSVRDLEALHASLAARPEIDGDRAAIYGRSYGGYMVLAALAFQPELWAAGVESVGISDLVTFLENTSDYRRTVREREYGRLDDDRDFLVEASPLTHAGRIRAPLFIQHGANDPRVPLAQTEQLHRVLTGNGVRCELLVHQDEGHGIGKRENRVDFFERAAAFLEDVLRS